MAEVRTLDPAKVVISVGGVPISGYADGTFIRVERSSDMFSKVIGADGKTARAKSNDRSGTVILTLLQTSPSNDVLSGLAILDELQNSGVVPIGATDLSGATTIFSGTGWVRKMPDWEAGKEIGNIEWTIDCADLEIFIGGNKASEAVLNQ